MYDRRGLFAKAAHRILAWRLISALKAKGVHRLPGLPFKMYLEPKFRSVGSLALYAIGSKYEPGLHLLPKLLRQGDVVFDCGANQGAYCLYAASLVGPAGRALAVEPQPYCVAAMEASAQANGFRNMTVVPAAISDKRGTLPFFFNSEAVAASLVNQKDGEAREVEVWTIDELKAAHGLPRVDLIKLDVEGVEAPALRGAHRTLETDRPLVMFEVWDPSEPNSVEAWNILAAAGYQIFDMLEGDRVALVERPVRSTGLLAVAPEKLERIEAFAGPQPRRASSAPAEFETVAA